MNERGAQALFLMLALVLPLSALVARGMPRRRVLRLGLIWLAIFAVAVLVAAMLPTRLRAAVLHNRYYQTGARS